MFRNGDYIYFDGFGRLNTESWENGYDKKLYDISNVLLNNGGCHFVNFDKYGFWYYSNGRILNFGKDYRLRKEFVYLKIAKVTKLRAFIMKFVKYMTMVNLFG